MDTGDTIGEIVHLAVIGLGSNLGASLNILRMAWHELLEQPDIAAFALSCPYLTEPVGILSVNRFINAVGLVQTSLTPHALLHLLHAIEARHGRERSSDGTASNDRTLDLDLLLYDDQVVSGDDLIIPHPRMHQRLFVLVPLAEIATDFIHPLFRKTIGSLVADIDDGFAHQLIKKVSWSPEHGLL